MPLLLDRRTGHVAVGTEDAAVAGLGRQRASARRAFVEVAAGINRHRLLGLPAAMWAGERAAQFQRCIIHGISARGRGKGGLRTAPSKAHDSAGRTNANTDPSAVHTAATHHMTTLVRRNRVHADAKKR